MACFSCCCGRNGKKKCVLMNFVDGLRGAHQSTEHTVDPTPAGGMGAGATVPNTVVREVSRGRWPCTRPEGGRETLSGGRVLWAGGRRERLLLPGTCPLPWPVPASIWRSWEEPGVCLLLLEVLDPTSLYSQHIKTWKREWSVCQEMI